MEYRKLGRSGTLVSTLALGTMNFGTPETPQGEAFAQLDAFIEAGGNLISLRRLGTDTIDLYQLHAWDPLTPVEETLSFLDSAARAGKIRYAGLSNFTGWQLQLAVSTAQAGGFPVPVTLQAQYNLATRQTEWEMIPAARHNGLGVLSWSPLASGFLTGKYARGERRSSGTRAGQDHALYQYTSANYENSDLTWSAVDAVNQVAKEAGASPAQVALGWVVSRPGVVSAIVGARNAQQLAGSLAAADLHLDPDALAALDAASDPNPAPYPYGPFGSAQRDRVANGPEALGALVRARAAESAQAN